MGNSTPESIFNAQVGPDKITFKNLAGQGSCGSGHDIADFIGALQSTYGTNRDLKLLVVGHRDQKQPQEVYRPFREIHMRALRIR